MNYECASLSALNFLKEEGFVLVFTDGWSKKLVGFHRSRAENFLGCKTFWITTQIVVKGEHRIRGNLHECSGEI